MPKPKEDEDTPVAADPEIARVAGALSQRGEDDREDAPVRAEPEEAAPPKRKKKAAAPSTTHRVTEFAGQINHDGVKYFAGDGIDLSENDAKLLGKSVEPAEPA